MSLPYALKDSVVSTRKPRAAVVALLFLAIAAGPAAALELTDCRISAGPAFPGIKARCGRFERPLNPHAPAAGRIRLSVAVVPARVSPSFLKQR